MDLILWRHAEAEDARGNDDLGRPLTARGRKQAERMAAWLAPRLPATTRILASPALRCQQTVAALGRSVSTVDAIGPGAAAQAVLDAAGWPGGGGAVLVVGHQPTLGESAARAMGEDDEHWRLRKGAVCWLRNDPNADAVEVHARKSPDDL
jgi:phosphohistidine phosphatase